MRKLALASICLYFFVCPLEFVFNAIIGSSAKYIALISVACILLYYVSDRTIKLRIGIAQYAILAWIILEAASLLWTTQTDITIDRIETYLLTVAYVLVVSVFPFGTKEFESVALCYAIGSFMALMMLFFSGDLIDGGNSQGRRTIYINGKWQDPNGLAAYLVAGMLYFLDKIFAKKWYSVVSVALVLVFAVGIIQTGSRGAFVGMVLAIAITLVIRAPKKARIKMVFGVLTLGVLCYFALEAFLPERLFKRLFDIQTYTGGSGRTELWLIAIDGVLKSPVFGNGIASHLAFFDDIINSESAMHNTYLCVLFEVGIVGLVAFVTPFIVSLYNSLKNKNMFIVSMIICNMIIVFFLDSIYLRYIWNALLLGVIYINICKTKKIEIVREGTK